MANTPENNAAHEQLATQEPAPVPRRADYKPKKVTGVKIALAVLLTLVVVGGLISNFAGA